MPSKTEAQRRLMGAELARKRAGRTTRTGMSEAQLEHFARKPVVPAGGGGGAKAGRKSDAKRDEERGERAKEAGKDPKGKAKEGGLKGLADRLHERATHGGKGELPKVGRKTGTGRGR